MMQTFRKISLYAATLWLGMQIMAGYIAAPVLFKMLPKMQAGEIAGVLFDILLLERACRLGHGTGCRLCRPNPAANRPAAFFIVRPCRQPIFGYTRYRGTEIRA